ncbi:MAG: GNAT family N-acetyltransferase [Flavobacteriaceae bacterium]
MQQTTNIQLKAICTKDTYAVRHPVLRNGLPLESCAFDFDDEPNTLHFGAFANETLVGVLTLLPKPESVQLRGMAVLEYFQGQGIGKQLVAHAEQYVRQQHICTVWLNARLIAVPFYEACGYQKQGETFELPYGGTHYNMIKQLCDEA